MLKHTARAGLLCPWPPPQYLAWPLCLGDRNIAARTEGASAYSLCPSTKRLMDTIDQEVFIEWLIHQPRITENLGIMNNKSDGENRATHRCRFSETLKP